MLTEKPEPLFPEEKLARCPFCNCDSIAIRGFTAVCRDCGASTSTCYSEQEAIQAWNTRSQPQGQVKSEPSEKTGQLSEKALPDKEKLNQVYEVIKQVICDYAGDDVLCDETDGIEYAEEICSIFKPLDKEKFSDLVDMLDKQLEANNVLHLLPMQFSKDFIRIIYKEFGQPSEKVLRDLDQPEVRAVLIKAGVKPHIAGALASIICKEFGQASKEPDERAVSKKQIENLIIDHMKKALTKDSIDIKGAAKAIFDAQRIPQALKIEWPCRKDEVANGDGKGNADPWSIGWNECLDACKSAYDQAQKNGRHERGKDG